MTAPSTEFEDFVLEQLDVDVSIERFFGGRCLKHDGAQFALLMGNTFFLRTSLANQSAFEEAGGYPFSYSTKRGRVSVKKYYAVPGDWFEDPDVLHRWIKIAIATARAVDNIDGESS